MYQIILLPLDGSPLAERALPYATLVARASGAVLVLVRAAQAAHGGAGDGDKRAQQAEAVREAEDYLAAVVGALARQEGQLPVETVVRYGPAAEAILQETRLREAGLVVMATHGRSGLGRWLYGSVADTVLRHATVPILLVPATAVYDWPQDRRPRMLLPLDGSELAAAILAPAGELATTLQATLLLLQVVEPVVSPYSELYGAAPFDPSARLTWAREYLEQMAAALRGRGHTVAIHAEVGPAASTIAAVARQQRADLIAMATHGRSGLARLVLGSVATGVLQLAGRPLLLVRPNAASQPAASASAQGAAHD
jgi:nucleotide-binding universal stress UspA family protein